MDKKIFVINGSGGSGKDTFVSFCGETKKVLNVSSIDKVREAAKILVGWNGEKDEVSRKLLVDLKKLSIDYNDAPTKYILSRAEEFMNSDYEMMFIHVREGEEIDKLKKSLNLKSILILNPNVEEIKSNTSDANVKEYNYDYTILNDGTLEDLKNKVKEFMGGLYGNTN